MGEEKHHFLTSLPGILSGLAAVVTALAGAYVLIGKTGAVRAPEPDPPVEAALQAPAPSPVAAEPAVPLSQPQPATATGAPFNVTAVINDPDGYVNVRSSGSAQSRIVAKVRLDEPIRTHPQTGAWWLVRTRDGTQGYIHASRIRMVEG